MTRLSWPRAAEGERLDRALGCMLGMVIGDSLGSQVEFQTADVIRAAYPDGVRDLADTTLWRTLAARRNIQGARICRRCGWKKAKRPTIARIQVMDWT